MSTMTRTRPAVDQGTGCGGRLVTPDGESLPLLGAALEADARGGIARVVLRQRFVNSGSEPLRLTYQVPIPADAAVSGYVFTVGDKRIVGEIDRRDAARERFEQALVEGHTAALLEQERTSIFTQEIGNVPAGTEVECALTLDQKLRWLDDGMWEWRFPTVVGPRYMGAPGRVADEKKITVDVSETPLPSTVSLMMSVRDEIAGGVAQSPSHPVVVEEESGRARIRLADGAGARLDRDVVVRWPVAEAKLGVTIDVARPESGQPTARSAYGLLTLVPPTAEQGGPTVPRDLILLIDTSGSMSGEPLDQAKLIAQDVVASMDARDRLEMVEFSSRPNRWKRRPQPMNDAARAEAEKWVQSLQAGGGTEMVDGIVEALRPLRDDAQRQVIILTDGYVGFEDEVVDAMRRDLPPNCRVHSVGVGSAPNQSLIGPVARIGRGVGMTIGLDEDAADGARRLVARTAAPIVVNASVSGDAVLDVPKHAMCDLYRGAPALIPMKLNGKGGEIVLQGETVDGAWRQTLTVPAVAAREGSAAVTTLYGREAVEELETTGVAGASLDRKIEQLGLRFQIATRMTSWVAVSEEPTVDPTEPVRRERIAQELPYGTSVEGLGLRGGSEPIDMSVMTCAMAPRPGRMRTAMRRSMDFDVLADASLASSEEGSLVAGSLRGTVSVTSDGRLVVEIEVEAAIEWKPSRVIHVVTDDGALHRVRLSRDGSTRAGTIPAGQVIRLLLKGGDLQADRIDAIRLENAGREITINVEPR